ncbi:MAG: hypothetical protein PHQ11_05300 [Paludibacter sp.]|nr:hypothetical protein [Paludibacter sp.]MDD4199503.1 hypothetical protein [Paludibacter sp.]MDD4428713.1 hypothetical protein [Paludibacter sp.]
MEIFKYILPAFIVMITAYLLFDKMLSNEEKKRTFELARKDRSAILALRLRAYERIMLLLERTNPANIALNIIQPGMNCLDFQTQMIDNIRKEFEHNYVQQIYVSDELWTAIGSTQENLIKLINTIAGHFKADDQAVQLAENFIRIYAETEENPTQIAIRILKSEVRNQFIQ